MLYLQFKASILRFSLTLAVFCFHVSTSLAAAPAVDMEKRLETDRIAAEGYLSNPKKLSVIVGASGKPFAAAKGNGGWGGGHSVRRTEGDSPILLDFFTADPEFRDLSFNNAKLQDTNFMKYYGPQKIQVQELAAYSQAKNILEAWKPKNQGLMKMILLALDKMPVHVVWRAVPLADAETYYLPRHLRSQYPQGVLTPVVAYFENLGLVISAPEWNQLGDLSQAGLLIHEALRRVQISYGLKVSQEKLQALTAAIALHSPSENIELESHNYLDEKLLVEIRRIATWKIAPGFALEGMCRNEITISAKSKDGLINGGPEFTIDKSCEALQSMQTRYREIFNFSEITPRALEFQKNYCNSKHGGRKDLDLLAIESVFYMKQMLFKIDTLTAEIKRKAGDSSFYNTDSEVHTTIVMASMDLANIVTTPARLKQIPQMLSQWRKDYCVDKKEMNATSFAQAALIVYASSEENKKQIEDITDAFISYNDHEVRTSVPEMREDYIAEERMKNKNRYEDTLVEDIITGHLQGKNFLFDWIPVIQKLRALEGYYRQLPAEVVRFRD